MYVDSSKKISDAINKFWFNYNVLPWNLNKPLQKIKGSELLGFVKNIPAIV